MAVEANWNGEVDVTERLEDLQDTVQSLPTESALRVAIAIVVEELTGDADYSEDPVQTAKGLSEFREEFDELKQTVQEHEKKIGQFGDGRPSSKDEAWAAIIEDAKKLRGNPEVETDSGENDVCLYSEHLLQATGYSERRCIDLIEEFGEEKHGATWKPHEPASAGNNGNARRKRLHIDMDVWGEGDE